MKPSTSRTIIAATSLVCLTVGWTVALLQGVNGMMTATIVAALSGIGGYAIKGKVQDAQDQTKVRSKKES